MSTIAEVVLRVDGIKLKKKHYSSSILVNCVGKYSSSTCKVYSSELAPFVHGTLIGVPFDNSLVGFEVRVHRLMPSGDNRNKENIDNSVTMQLGTSYLSIKSHVSHEYSISLELEIHNESGDLIGKLTGKTAFHTVDFKDNRDSVDPRKPDDAVTGAITGITNGIKQYPLRKFSFVPLSEPIPWEVIANTSLERIRRTNKVSNLPVLLDMVQNGNIQKSPGMNMFSLCLDLY